VTISEKVTAGPPEKVVLSLDSACWLIPRRAPRRAQGPPPPPGAFLGPRTPPPVIPTRRPRRVPRLAAPARPVGRGPSIAPALVLRARREGPASAAAWHSRCGGATRFGLPDGRRGAGRWCTRALLQRVSPLGAIERCSESTTRVCCFPPSTIYVCRSPRPLWRRSDRTMLFRRSHIVQDVRAGASARGPRLGCERARHHARGWCLGADSAGGHRLLARPLRYARPLRGIGDAGVPDAYDLPNARLGAAFPGAAGGCRGASSFSLEPAARAK
jgi:hypothetical protein